MEPLLREVPTWSLVENNGVYASQWAIQTGELEEE